MVLSCGCDDIWTPHEKRCIPCRNRISLGAQDLIDRDRGKAPWQRDQQGRYDEIHYSDIKHEQTFPREERTIWSRKT